MDTRMVCPVTCTLLLYRCWIAEDMDCCRVDCASNRRADQYHGRIVQNCLWFYFAMCIVEPAAENWRPPLAPIGNVVGGKFAVAVVGFACLCSFYMVLVFSKVDKRIYRHPLTTEPWFTHLYQTSTGSVKMRWGHLHSPKPNYEVSHIWWFRILTSNGTNIYPNDEDFPT